MMLNKCLLLKVSLSGGADFICVQDAVAAVPAGQPALIQIAPGTYTGALTVPADKPGLILEGLGATPADVVLCCDHHHGAINPQTGTLFGTTGSASSFLLANDFTARNLTFANTFAGQDPAGRNQAVAVKTEGDRMFFERCRFLGLQDTLYVNTPAPEQIARQYFRDCEIEGDVDFIFGRATAVFEHCRIRALSHRVAHGYFAAPSTWEGNPKGFLFQYCHFEGEAAAHSFALGRPWAADKAPQLPRGTISNGQMVVRDSMLEALVGPWVDFDGASPCAVDPARMREWANRGPGADQLRPQLDAKSESAYRAANYLRGQDGWAPDLLA